MSLTKEINNKLYRRLMYQYFEIINDWPYLSTITHVKVFKTTNSDEIIIEIETHRPGILIGKAGVFINGLKAFIEKETNENIYISLKECQLWHNLR